MMTLTNSNLATVLPVLEWADGGESPAGLTADIDLKRGGRISPRFTGASLPGEEIIGRWFVMGALLAIIDDDGRGLGRGGRLAAVRIGDDGATDYETVGPDGSEEVGRYSMVSVTGDGGALMACAVTDRRLLGHISAGETRWGTRTDVLWSWPYELIENVGIMRPGTADSSGAVASVGSVRPMATLDIAEVTRPKPNGKSRWRGTKGGAHAFAEQIIRAAATYRRDHAVDDTERGHLDAVLAGRREREGDEQVAWFDDPDKSDDPGER